MSARIPDTVTDDEAAFTVIGAIALQGIRLAQPTLGEAFVVSGLGLRSGSTEGTGWVLVLVKLPPFVAGFEKPATLNRQIGGDFRAPRAGASRVGGAITGSRR